MDPVRRAYEGATTMTIDVTAGHQRVGVEPSGTDITLSFQGRFPFGIDRWAYVPFDVPPGVRRISVSTTHDRF